MTKELISFCNEKIKAKQNVLFPCHLFYLPSINKYADIEVHTSKNMNFEFIAADQWDAKPS